MTLGNLGVLVREVTRLYGPLRIWITEYGYQTNPPDRVFGVSWAKQALYLQQACRPRRANPRVDVLLWFLLQDEAPLGRWQSGLSRSREKRKPAFAVFARLGCGATGSTFGSDPLFGLSPETSRARRRRARRARRRCCAP